MKGPDAGHLTIKYINHVFVNKDFILVLEVE